MRRCISAAIAFVALVAFLAACEGRDLPVVLLPSPAPALAFTDPAPTRTAPPPTPTVSPMPTTTPAPDFTTPLPQPTLSAEEMAVIYRLSPEEQEEVRYAYWLETTTDRWATEVMNPATQEHSHALLRKDYDAFCAVAVADPGPLRAELDARPAPSSLEDAHRYAAVILERWQDYRASVKSFCGSRDTHDLAGASQALSEAGTAYKELRTALRTFYDALSIRIGLAPAPGHAPLETPDPDALPTMSPETRKIFLRAGADRLDREMGEWMERVAHPRLAELQDALDRGDFGAACQVTVVDVGSIVLGMTPPIAGLEALQPAHDAARETLTGWQDLRSTLQRFCRTPKTEGVPAVVRAMDRVVSSFQDFESELQRLR